MHPYLRVSPAVGHCGTSGKTCIGLQDCNGLLSNASTSFSNWCRSGGVKGVCVVFSENVML